MKGECLVFILERWTKRRPRDEVYPDCPSVSKDLSRKSRHAYGNKIRETTSSAKRSLDSSATNTVQIIWYLDNPASTAKPFIQTRIPSGEQAIYSFKLAGGDLNHPHSSSPVFPFYSRSASRSSLSDSRYEPKTITPSFKQLNQS